MLDDRLPRPKLSEHDTEDSVQWPNDFAPWEDHPLEFDVVMPLFQARLTPPYLLDLHHALKRHRLIFGFYARPVFLNSDGTRRPGSRYFHKFPFPIPYRGAPLPVDQLFIRAEGIETHLDQVRDEGCQHPGSFFYPSWQGLPLLELSAQEAERIHDEILNSQPGDWPEHENVRLAVRSARPAFPQREDWTFTTGVAFAYPDLLKEQITYLAGIAMQVPVPSNSPRPTSNGNPAVQTSLSERPSEPEDVPITNGASLIGPTLREHSPDFRSVCWDNVPHVFTTQQAVVVELLWREYSRAPGLGMAEATIGERLNYSGQRYRLDHTFRTKDGAPHSALRTMIVSPSKGFYCLEPPKDR